ncbi:MAG: hypothetical protein ABI539_10050 [Acidobacteriota bacterium]
MTIRYLLITLAVTAAAIFTACGGTTTGPETNNSASNARTNANSAPSNVNGPLTAATATPSQTVNNAPTLTPVYKAYCAAYVKKDEAAVRKAYSRATLAFFEANMKEDGVKSLIEYLSDDGISNEVCEVRNEIINGDTATAEITTKAYPKGFPVVFEKEDGQWKITNKRPEGALK